MTGVPVTREEDTQRHTVEKAELGGDEATSQGPPGIAGNHREPEETRMDPSLEIPEGTDPTDTLVLDVQAPAR